MHDNEHTTTDVLGGFVVGAVLAGYVFLRTLALLPADVTVMVREKVPADV